MKTSFRFALLTGTALLAAPAIAQTAPAADAASTEEIVVTGVARGTNRLDSSVTTSSIS